MGDQTVLDAKPLGIIAAMAEEAEGLIAEMRAHPRATVIALGGRDFYAGTLWDRSCVLTLARIGKVASATTAAAMIHHFDVGGIVFTGVAGGVAQHVKVGDVVIADALMQHDLDASPIFPRYEVPLLGIARFKTDADLNARLAVAVGDFLAQDVPKLPETIRSAFGLKAPSLHRGLIASGDRFINSSAAILALRSELPETLAIEMEGAAVAQVCHDYRVPCAVMRTVSDGADDAAHVDFPAFLRNVASAYSFGVVRRFLSS